MLQAEKAVMEETGEKTIRRAKEQRKRGSCPKTEAAAVLWLDRMRERSPLTLQKPPPGCCSPEYQPSGPVPVPTTAGSTGNGQFLPSSHPEPTAGASPWKNPP